MQAWQHADSSVTIDEVLTLVNIALGNAPVTSCPAADSNHDGQVTVDELVAAVINVMLYPEFGSCWAAMSQR